MFAGQEAYSVQIHAITVHVKIDSKLFRRFALFDTFIRQRRYKAPALFMAIFLAFSIVAFASGRKQSAMLGSLLLGVGVLLPLAYLLSFLLQVHDQCRRLGLKAPRPAYTLNLTETELRVINDMKSEPELRLPYDALHGVYRAKGAYYLYVAPTRAFILPDAQNSLSPAQMWDYLSERLAQDKLHGKRP